MKTKTHVYLEALVAAGYAPFRTESGEEDHDTPTIESVLALAEREHAADVMVYLWNPKGRQVIMIIDPHATDPSEIVTRYSINNAFADLIDDVAETLYQQHHAAVPARP